MNRWIFAPLLGAALLASASAAAQGERGRDMDGREGRGMMGRFSPDDMDAFMDARIAALRAGLKLSGDQERLWPAVEDAMRSLVKQRREQRREWREGRGQGSDDIPAILRGMADRQTSRGEALRKLADAAAPLYATFDEGQKRRLRVLVRGLRPRGPMGGGWDGRERGMRSWRDRHER
jgi:zinc resistance-associated protein